MESFPNCAEQNKNAQTAGQMCEEFPSNENSYHNLQISRHVQLLKATNRLTDEILKISAKIIHQLLL